MNRIRKALGREVKNLPTDVMRRNKLTVVIFATIGVLSSWWTGEPSMIPLVMIVGFQLMRFNRELREDTLKNNREVKGEDS